jgi:hypothetical protein
MAVVYRVAKGSKLTIAELDNNFSELVAASASLALKTDIINTRVTQSVLAFPNLLIGANGVGGVGLITSGNLHVSGTLGVSGSIIASGSTNSVLASNYANDGAAAAGGIPIGGMYHNAGAVRIRLT